MTWKHRRFPGFPLQKHTAARTIALQSVAKRAALLNFLRACMPSGDFMAMKLASRMSKIPVQLTTSLMRGQVLRMCSPMMRDSA